LLNINRPIHEQWFMKLLSVKMRIKRKGNVLHKLHPVTLLRCPHSNRIKDEERLQVKQQRTTALLAFKEDREK
jgi:hypothetical protein